MSRDREQQAADVERRRRMAEIFGDALPEQTRDECAEARADERPRGGAGDEEWLRRQVPPHHG